MSVTPNSYNVIGLMSGTSLDGLDIAYCHFYNDNNTWTFDLLHTQSIEYPLAYKEKLKNTIHLSAVQLLAFHNEYGNWLGECTKKFISQHAIDIDFVASHGHTVFHQPKIGLTLQIGSGQHLANACKQKVICDFRTNDVALGGQGAPLVPVGDRLLFSNYDFCLNLGGISNISFDHQGERIAYDISPANMLLNYSCAPIGLEYDKGGQLARTGKINTVLLDLLNDLPYYKLPFPKSLGYEWFADQVIPIIKNANDTSNTILHTAVHHISEQIANSIRLAGKQNTSVLVTGGGAKNHFLIEVLQQKLQKTCTIIVPDESLIDFKEAMIFAFMGVLRDRNEINCLQSVTGADRDSSSGVIYNPS